MIGGAGSDSGRIRSRGDIASVTIDGHLIPGTGAGSAAIARPDGTLGPCHHPQSLTRIELRRARKSSPSLPFLSSQFDSLHALQGSQIESEAGAQGGPFSRHFPVEKAERTARRLGARLLPPKDALDKPRMTDPSEGPSIFRGGQPIVCNVRAYHP